MNQHITFAALVDEAVQRATDTAAPFVPSRAQYEDALNWVCLIVGDFADPWAFIKATHRGAGTMDAVASELFKRLSTNHPHAPVNKAAIYVFRDAACKEFGFTLFSCYFKTMSEAETYAKEAGHKFFEIVDFGGSTEQAKNRGCAL